MQSAIWAPRNPGTPVNYNVTWQYMGDGSRNGVSQNSDYPKRVFLYPTTFFVTSSEARTATAHIAIPCMCRQADRCAAPCAT